MKYLTVGRDTITKEKFREIKDLDERSLKPDGGMWFTRHYEGEYFFNEWVEFLIENPSILHAKSKYGDFSKQPCAIVELKEDSKIYNLCDKESYEYIMDYYSHDHKTISFELLSHDYDGIYVDIGKLLRNMSGDESYRIHKAYGVNSLILFNPDCIDNYQSGVISIDYDPDGIYGVEESRYSLNCDKTRKRVK